MKGNPVPQTPVVPVIPRPVSVEPIEAAPFTLAPDARISVAGCGADAVARSLAAALAGDCGRHPAIVHEPPAYGDFAIVIAEGEAPDGHSAEGYTVTVTAEGVRIGADTEAGAFFGVQTVRQLIPVSCGADPLTIPAVSIRDHPRYAYRGAMLDVARHFFTVEEVERFIDAIVPLKLNHLHLHLTDDQGWRIDIESWPNLARHGGSTGSDGSRGGYYTQDDYRRLVAYAAERHITIVPEIDMPGHTNAALASYPQLNPSGDRARSVHRLEGRLQHPRRRQHDHVRVHRRRDPRGRARSRPGPYLHIGGDECLSTPPRAVPAVHRPRIRRSPPRTARRSSAGTRWGRATGCRPGTVGQYWDFLTPRGDAAEDALSFVRQGGSVIMSPADVVLPRHRVRGRRPARPGLGGRADDHPGLLRVGSGAHRARARGCAHPRCRGSGVDRDARDHRGGRIDGRSRGSQRSPRSPGRRRPPTPAEIESVRDFEEFAPRLAALGERWEPAGTVFRRVPEVPWAPCGCRQG